MADHERLGGASGEKLEISKELLDEQQERMRDRLEKERRPDNKAERMAGARNELERQFAHEKQGNKSRQPSQAMPKSPTMRTPAKKATKHQKKTAYKKTLSAIQKDMSPASRTFSKVIHNPVVEKTSDAVGSTVARPAPLFIGSLSALVLTSIVYLVTQYYGYMLSGFEWTAAFALGWAIGLIIDWIRVAMLGRRAGPA
jgi:hypothetical protein